MGTPPRDPGRAQRTAAIISASFIMSVLMYGVVVNLFRITTQEPFGGFLRLPQILLYFPRSDAWEEGLEQRP